MVQFFSTVHEAERLNALRRYDILDTPPDGAFDTITTLAAHHFKVPIAIVSLVDHDRIWFKSRFGVDVSQIPRDPGLCASAILTDEFYLVTNAIEDPRALANPLVAGELGFRFYAAAQLRTHDGYNLGTLCVIDYKSRQFPQDDQTFLQDLAKVVMDQMELRLNARKQAQKEEQLRAEHRISALRQLYEREQEVTKTLQELNRMKTNFMIVTSHEMRTPLTILKGYIEVLLDQYLGPIAEPQQQSLVICQRMIDRMVTSFNNILEMLKMDQGRIVFQVTQFQLYPVIQGVFTELSPFFECRCQKFSFECPPDLLISADREKLQLVLTNLIQNAVKFTPDHGQIRVAVKHEPELVHIRVIDSGIGIDPKEIESIFEKFYTSADSSMHSSGKFEFSTRGAGLGLAIAKGYIEAHGGHIWAESAGPGQGSSFHITLPLKNFSQCNNMTTETDTALV